MPKSSQARYKKRVPIAEPLQRTFCKTAANFASVHGLSTVGKDPRHIREITPADWTNVFACPMPGRGQKIKHDEVREEYHEDLILLHWKVYQELPKNGELGIYFAKGFALERSKVAPEHINWAQFAKEAMNWLEKHNQLEGKMDKWQLKENRVLKRSFHGGISSPRSNSVPQPSASYGGFCSKLNLAKEEEDILNKMVVSLGKKISDLMLEIEEARGSVKEANNEFHLARGSLSQKSNFEEIQSLLAEIQGASHIISKVQYLFPNEDELRELEKKVAATKATLEDKERTLEKARLNFSFVSELQKKANESAQILARPLLSALHVDLWEGISISGFSECSGCGHPFNACAPEVFSLPC